MERKLGHQIGLVAEALALAIIHHPFSSRVRIPELRSTGFASMCGIRKL